MIKLAITGGIACGKSEVGSQLSAAGIPVCEADDLAHAAMAAGRDVHRSVVRAFGSGIVGSDGEIDRHVLGRRVFEDPAALATLNRLVHPEVRRAWVGWLAERRAEGAKMAAVIVPLLYEVGDADAWDVVVCVTAPRDMQVARLMERGLTQVEAGQRIASQMDVKEKAIRADYVIVNHGTFELLKRQTSKVLDSILETM